MLYDAKEADLQQDCPHAAISDPTVAENVRMRESIEVRALVINSSR